MSESRPESIATPGRQNDAAASAIEDALAASITRLAQSRDFAKPSLTPRVLEQARKLLMQPDGASRLYRHAAALEDAGIFAGTDWVEPHSLLPGLVSNTLENGHRHTVMIECISELRFLAIANGAMAHHGVSPEQARHFLTQVLALNLNRLFPAGQTEAERLRDPEFNAAINRLLRFLLEHIGFKDILGSLVDEVMRILNQRPIQVTHVKSMITQIAVARSRSTELSKSDQSSTDRLIRALFGPTAQSVDDPGIPAYRQRLALLDQTSLLAEAAAFASSMHATGLVSDYHADFLRWLIENNHGDLVPTTLGVSSTGVDVISSYSTLVNRLIQDAIYPETAQAVYGLSMLLERGILYTPSVAAGLWRQIGLQLSTQNQNMLAGLFGSTRSPRVFLLAGVISVLGQPLGLGQGNNPSCQSARAIAMWSFADPDYLMHLVTEAARFDTLLMPFEGQSISSADLPFGLVHAVPIDNDAVSTLLVPHLDKIYVEMGRRCVGRGEDPHYWVNPEFHGWWVGRNFTIAVDVDTGMLKDFDGFIRHFLASYHPYYNGGQPVIHPQPAGLAVTDSTASFVGWHAITLLRVAIDKAGDMRVYFFNPNNDSGQNWGNGVVVSTQGNGERYGESSLPIAQLASRLYIFHDDPLAQPALDVVPDADVAEVKQLAIESWAAGREG